MEENGIQRSEKLQFGSFLLILSLILIALAINNFNINNSGFDNQQYENISDKIKYAEIQYYYAGKHTRRQIAIILQNRPDLILEFRGYSKSMVDERYFVTEKNWGNNMVFTVKKTSHYIKQVSGLKVNGKIIFTAKQTYRHYYGNSYEKGLIELVLGIISLIFGCSLLFKNWNYFKK